MTESSPLNRDRELREAAATYPGSPTHLDLPVAVEPPLHAPHLSPAEYVVWCEEMRELCPPTKESLALRTQAHCSVPFAL